MNKLVEVKLNVRVLIKHMATLIILSFSLKLTRLLRCKINQDIQMQKCIKNSTSTFRVHCSLLDRL